ncbi:hypothetical protein [Dokdonella sp.]|uniref:hypothetical protein n=1 Tax=Dokdonella sp. TaxID=2291710 RepID=UPI003783720C
MALATASLLASATSPAFAAHPGDVDGSFGQGGFLTNDFFGTDEQVFAVAPMRDGRVVAAGKVTATNITGSGGSENMAIARYLPNGTLDPGFGSGGLVHIDIDSASDEVRALRVLSDNSILAAGSLSTSSHADFGILKLRADGSRDTSFGEPDIGNTRKGFVRLDIAGANFHDNAYAMALQRDGRIVLAGVTPVFHDGFNYGQVAVARFTADGVLDATFGGGDGIVVLDPFVGAAADVLTTIALDQAGNLGADDRIVIGGHTFGNNCAFLARLTANGAVDTTFGTNGRVIIAAANTGGVQTGMSFLASARLAADGKILALGEGGDRGMTLMRFSANGSLDTTFGTNGRSLIKFSGVSDEDIPAALALQGNGKIVAAGHATSRATGAAHKDFFVGRWLPNGAVDTAFGDQGSKVVQVAAGEDEAFALAVEVSGNLLAGGYSTRPNVAPRDYALLRLLGDPDRIFANGFDGPAF